METLNWCSGVKEGSTELLRLRWRACFLRVVSDTDLDIPILAPVSVSCPPPGVNCACAAVSVVILTLSTLLSRSSPVSMSSISSSPLSVPRTASWSCGTTKNILINNKHNNTVCKSYWIYILILGVPSNLSFQKPFKLTIKCIKEKS